MGQIARLAAEQRDDVGDGALQPAGRHGFARRGKASENPIAGRLFVALRQLHAGDAALAPDDAAVADRRFEQCKTKIFHNKIFRNKLAHDGINIVCDAIAATRFVLTCAAKTELKPTPRPGRSSWSYAAAARLHSGIARGQNAVTQLKDATFRLVAAIGGIVENDLPTGVGKKRAKRRMDIATVRSNMNPPHLPVHDIETWRNDVQFRPLNIHFEQVDALERRQHVPQRQCRDEFKLTRVTQPELLRNSRGIIEENVAQDSFAL